MSVIGSNILAGASGQGGGYNISRSLRFKTSGSQTYLTRTPSSTGNRRTFTYSTWVKRSEYTYWRGLLGSGDIGTVGIEYLRFSNDGSGVGAPLCNIEFGAYGVSGVTFNVYTTSSFRDPSAWYHVVLAVDTTQATEANRVKIYVNNVQQTLVGTYPTQNLDTYFNSSSYAQAIGDIATTGVQAFDGYMTETRLIDGQQLTPSSFGEYSSTTGVWQPKAYAGTYGTNGYFLNFSNNASTTTLGYDFSGNGNNYTANNFSLTAGSTYDSMTDVPTLTSATSSNFAVFNPLASAGTFSNANLNLAVGSSGESSGLATMALPSTGKYYWEVLVTAVGSDYLIGISDGSSTTNPTSSGTFYFYRNTGQKQQSGSTTSYGASYTTNDVIGIALDMDGGTITFYKNNTSQGQAFSGISGSNYRPTTYLYNNASAAINFGQRPFAYTPPTGYVALNTFNLPTPTIGATASTQAGKFFNAVTYTGNGASRTISGVGFQPDLVWVKVRSTSGTHILTDAVRGGNKQIYSNLTNGEGSATNKVTGFASDGFTLGADDGSGTGDANFNGSTYVAWCWDANGAGSSNTAGSITSTVSANTTAGFSIVKWAYNSGGGTIGHGLGVAPKVILQKDLVQYNWDVYHADIGATKRLILNNTNTPETHTGVWNNTAPTSSVFSSGSGWYTGGENIISYCFAEVAGFSKFGSYTGNGSTDGPMVFTGFLPRFIMTKRTDTTSDWIIYDTARDTYNAEVLRLYPNASNAEGNAGAVDGLSNGFKLRDNGASQNASGGTYIYMAFASVPQKFSLGR